MPSEFSGSSIPMHRPKPGPVYWDYRCLECGEPVADHAPWWRCWLAALGLGDQT